MRLRTLPVDYELAFHFLTVAKMNMLSSFWINLSVLPHWMAGTMTTCQLVFRCTWRDMPVHGLNVYKALMKWLSMNYLQLWSTWIILRRELLSGISDRPWANCVNLKRSLLLIIRTMCVYLGLPRSEWTHYFIQGLRPEIRDYVILQ